MTVQRKRTKLGHQLGVLFCLGGFLLVWVGWNGAASYDSGVRQFPYLISGGIAGLGLIHVGVGLWLVQSQRTERARLEDHLAGLNRVLETLVEVVGVAGAGNGGGRPLGNGNGNGLVLAGKTAYHRPSCRLVQDHPQLATTTAELASDSGLIPCRTCDPQPHAVHAHG